MPKWELDPQRSSIPKSVNVIDCINRRKDKSHDRFDRSRKMLLTKFNSPS